MAGTIHTLWTEYRRALLVSTGLLALSACLHIWWQSSPMTLPEEIWRKILDAHLTYYPFVIRPFQTRATLLLHDLLGLPIRESFYALQFTLTLLLGVLFYRILRLLDFSKGWSLIGLAALMLSYPIMGAHFAPTHTWDDFWCYLFLVLTFSAVLKERPVTAGVLLTLGCFAREQALVFYLPLTLWAWWSGKELSRTRTLIMLAMPPLVYGVYRWIVFESFELTRFSHLHYNFETALRINDTVVSAWIAFGVLWLTVLGGISILKARQAGAHSRLLFWGVVITLPVTFLLTISTGMARETRIFFPPFLFVIPVSLYFLRDIYFRTRPYFTRVRAVMAALGVVVAVGLGYLTALELFPHFDYGTNAVFRRQVAGLHIGLALSLTAGYMILRWREWRAAGAISRK